MIPPIRPGSSSGCSRDGYAPSIQPKDRWKTCFSRLQACNWSRLKAPTGGLMMHTRRILAMACKDAIDIVKNKQTFIGLLTPFVMGIVFIFLQVLFSGRGITQVYIYDPDHSNISTIVSSVFDKPEIVYARSAVDVTAEFGSDRARTNTPYAMGLIVPAGFEESVRQGQHPQV